MDDMQQEPKQSTEAMQKTDTLSLIRIALETDDLESIVNTVARRCGYIDKRKLTPALLEAVNETQDGTTRERAPLLCKACGGSGTQDDAWFQVVTCAGCRGTGKRNDAVLIDYTNHRGERSQRSILPCDLRYEHENEWHGAGWILHAWDIEKDAFRSFAMKDIHKWEALNCE